MINKIAKFLKDSAVFFVFLLSPGLFGFDDSKQLPLWVAITIDLMLVVILVLALLVIFVVITER